MNVYDLDKTIYHRDSSVQFYLYELVRKPYLAIYWPVQIYGAICYAVKLIDKVTMKGYFYRYMKSVKDIDGDVRRFWDKNMSRIHKWYLDQHHDDDVVITASPVWLVEEACRRLSIKYVYGSLVDRKTGKILGPNCHDRQKVTVFREAGFNTDDIDCFYSDSHSDDPLAELARSSYLVKGERLLPWSEK